MPKVLAVFRWETERLMFEEDTMVHFNKATHMGTNRAGELVTTLVASDERDLMVVRGQRFDRIENHGIDYRLEKILQSHCR